MLGSQEKILEPKVNVKFFTVDPYTMCNRVSRPFPIGQFGRHGPFWGRKTCFSVVSSKGEIKYEFMDDFRVFWATRTIFGSFRRFQNF